MVYEISSGNGPAECELAVTKFSQYLQKNYDVQIISTSDGFHAGTYRSVTIFSKYDLSEFTGSVLWTCKSAYRPTHKRKNWFIDFKESDAAQNIDFDPANVAFSTFRSGGNGGQNVNKVETGVRATYLSSGDSTVCTDERSQYANKKKALERLEVIVKSKNNEAMQKTANEMRKAHVNLERGNASVKFEGENFRRIY